MLRIFDGGYPRSRTWEGRLNYTVSHLCKHSKNFLFHVFVNIKNKKNKIFVALPSLQSFLSSLPSKFLSSLSSNFLSTFCKVWSIFIYVIPLLVLLSLSNLFFSCSSSPFKEKYIKRKFPSPKQQKKPRL